MKNILTLALVLTLATTSIEAKNAPKKVQNAALLRDENKYDECCSPDNSCQQSATTQTLNNTSNQAVAEEQSFLQTLQNSFDAALNWFKRLFNNDCCDCSENNKCSTHNDSCDDIDSDIKDIPLTEN
jgi:hypothetical protein